MTSTDTRPAAQPAARKAHRLTELPAPFTVQFSRIGERLAFRYIERGQPYGINGINDEGPLIEVRLESDWDAVHDTPGRPVVVLEAAAVFVDYHRAWQLSDPAMPHAMSSAAFEEFLCSFRVVHRQHLPKGR